MNVWRRTRAPLRPRIAQGPLRLPRDGPVALCERDAGDETAVPPLRLHARPVRRLVGRDTLAPHLDHVLTSARTGYEKPHPRAFRLALAAAGDPREAWMVGDNAHADVGGAESVGLPAILVRADGPARLRADGLAGAAALILGAPSEAAATG